MKEPTYEEHLQILNHFLNSDVPKDLKIKLIEAFCKRFGKTKDALMIDLCSIR